MPAPNVESPVDIEHVRERVESAVQGFLASHLPLLDAISPDTLPLQEALLSLLAGGKRLRPAFCYWGWRSTGAGGTDAAVAAAASLELLQACALIHDDVMDGSDTRRGQPAAHRRLATVHAEGAWNGSADDFGVGGAILLGDLCLSWADELLYASGLEALALERGKPLYDIMRTELMAGQYLDLLEQARGGGTVEQALTVVRYKSAKYTIERPLHLGAALAGGDGQLLSALSEYGLPLGAAFQLRDDVLGVFGDPAQTGKPAGDDLREGKRTALVAQTLARASAAEAATFERLLGDPDLAPEGVDTLRGIIVESGALERIEAMIEAATDEAFSALGSPLIADEARPALQGLAVAATTRSV